MDMEILIGVGGTEDSNAGRVGEAVTKGPFEKEGE